MIKVITYGTFDKLHYGHIKLLERAKQLGDYLVVGVTSDDYDKSRGKINVVQTLSERVFHVREIGIADEVIVEEYEGQKIDDIRRKNIDIFAIGSDWKGKFDYLRDICEVVYLDRTEGISSSQVRKNERHIRLGIVADSEARILDKFYKECMFVDGLQVVGLCSKNKDLQYRYARENLFITDDYHTILNDVDAVYILSHPEKHYMQIKLALCAKKHVICESPIALTEIEVKELFDLAKKQGVVLMDAIKTAYSTAYNRLLLLLKSGKIGKIISVDATCTSVQNIKSSIEDSYADWNSICAWGPTAFLPVFQLLGYKWDLANIYSSFFDKNKKMDSFTKIDFKYPKGVATIKVGRGIKSEGELIISGSEGYVYVPPPWWKTDYFEVRYEHQEQNQRYFYQLEGEGIRYELVCFLESIETKNNSYYIDEYVSEAICRVIESFYNGNVIEIEK